MRWTYDNRQAVDRLHILPFFKIHELLEVLVDCKPNRVVQCLRGTVVRGRLRCVRARAKRKRLQRRREQIRRTAMGEYERYTVLRHQHGAVKRELSVALPYAHRNVDRRPAEGNPPHAVKRSVVPGRVIVSHSVTDAQQWEGRKTEEVIHEDVREVEGESDEYRRKLIEKRRDEAEEGRAEEVGKGPERAGEQELGERPGEVGRVCPWVMRFELPEKLRTQRQEAK
jgi:hypothetical protein